MTKATNLYLLLAKEFITDPEDKMNSIIKIIDKFTTKVDKKKADEQKSLLKDGQSIAVPIPFFIVSTWIFDKKLNEEESVKITMSIYDPNGKNLSGPEQEYILPSKIDRISMNFKSDLLPITVAGKYVLKSKLESLKSGKILGKAEYPYEVEILKP